MNNIIICGTCKGEGKNKHWEEGHNPDFYFEPCPTCNGTGRLMTDTIIITVPFGTDPNETEYYDVNSKIFKLAREYENKVYEKNK